MLKNEDKKSSKCFIYFAVVSANLSSFMAGNGISWPSPVIPKISKESSDNPLSRLPTTLEISCIVSAVQLGAVIGTLFAGICSEKFGRKKSLLICTVPILICHLILAFTRSIELFITARFLCGMGLGCVFSVLPSYISEISQIFNRGLMNFYSALMLTLGTLSNYIIGPYVTIPIFSFINLIPYVLFLLLFGFLVPESPYYFIHINKKHLAEKALQKFRSESKQEIAEELLEITKIVEKSKANRGQFKNLFHSKLFVKGLLISCGAMLFQHLSGIGALQSYMEAIFLESKIPIRSELAVDIVATIQFIATLCASQLVDRIGRKMLMLFSTSGCCLSLLLFGVYFYLKENNYYIESISWLPILCLTMYFISYSIGLGPIPWTILGELFSTNSKSLASTITTAFCLSVAFTVTVGFPLVSDAIGLDGAFWILSVGAAAGIIFSKFCIIETKGKSLQEIQEMLAETKAQLI